MAHIRGRMPNNAPHPIDVHVGLRVKQRRHELGISQEQLGEAIGLSFQQVQKYEKGTNRISASRMWSLCRVLQITPAWLFEDMPGDLKRAQTVVAFAKLKPRDDDTSRDVLEMIRAYETIPTKELQQLARRYLRDLADAAGAQGHKKRA